MIINNLATLPTILEGLKFEKEKLYSIHSITVKQLNNQVNNGFDLAVKNGFFKLHSGNEYIYVGAAAHTTPPTIITPIQKLYVGLSSCGVTTTKYNLTATSLIDVLGAIKNGTYRKLIAELRALPTKELQKSFKANKLPYFTPFGNFAHRTNGEKPTYNGVLCFDVDKQDNLEVDFNQLKSKLQKNRYVLSYFTSPTGGLKVLAYTNINITNKEQLIYLHNAVIGSEFSFVDLVVKFDIKQYDSMNRTCFISDDKDLYINEKAIPYAKIAIPTHIGAEKNTPPSQNRKIKINTIDKAVEYVWQLVERKGLIFSQGNYHNYFLKFAVYCLHYGIGKNECLEYAESFGVPIRTNCISYPYEKYTSLNWNLPNKFAQNYSFASSKEQENSLVDSIKNKLRSKPKIKPVGEGVITNTGEVVKNVFMPKKDEKDYFIQDAIKINPLLINDFSLVGIIVKCLEKNNPMINLPFDRYVEIVGADKNSYQRKNYNEFLQKCISKEILIKTNRVNEYIVNPYVIAFGCINTLLSKIEKVCF